MDLIQEINEKYSALEQEVERKLKKVYQDEERLKQSQRSNATKFQSENKKVLSYEEAIQRNANLIKALEKAKARLRSRSTYSPVEQILSKSIENYKLDVLSTSDGAVGGAVNLCASTTGAGRINIYDIVPPN